MATRLLKNGPEFQVNVDAGGGTGILGNQFVPDAVALTDGRFAITYQSDVLGTPNDQAVFRLLGSSVNFADLFNSTASQGQPAAAPLANGGFGVVFTNERHAGGGSDANGLNITYRPVTASGSMGNTLAIADFDDGLGHDSLSNPDIATLSSGRQVVVFERFFSPSDHDIFLNVVNAAGTATEFSAASPLAVENNASRQDNPSVAASGNQALVVYEDATGTTMESRNVTARLLDGGSNTLGPSFAIADHATALFHPNVAALADNRYVIVYADGDDVWGRIYDPSTPGGAFLSAEFQVDTLGSSAEGAAPSVAGTADGGFIVTWVGSNGSDYDVLAHRFDARGQSYGDIVTVGTLTDEHQFDPTIATSGANVLIAWADAGSRPTDVNPSSVRAQQFTTTVFDYDSAGLGDLDGNGRADILFQNDTGEVMVWQTNGNGAVSAVTSIGTLPTGIHIFGTGNFNGTPGDDILLRSTGGTLAIWPTSGIAVGSPAVIGSTSASYHNAGIGDFTGDGQEDLLFQGDAGDIVTWAVANNALAAAPQVLGSTSKDYHIVGIDDFTGDGQADILFRHDNGDIALWQIANNQLQSAKVIGSTSPSYHVVSTGDFDGNGANDILFRSDTGELVEWLLDSTGGLLAPPTSIGVAGPTYHVDGTGDLNGDGRDDILFRDAGGTLVEWLMNGTSIAAPPVELGYAPVDYAIAAHHFDLI